MSGMVAFLRERGVDVGWRAGWQSVKCPYHGDSSASASVHIDRGKFHCFACGIFEDVIGLLRMEGANYAEAKRQAAEGYGESPATIRGQQIDRPSISRGTGDLLRGGTAAPVRRRLLE